MNYLQAYYELPFAIVYQEDKADYFSALQQSRKEENICIFQDFMFSQYQKFLTTEIKQYQQDMSRNLPEKQQQGKGSGYSLFF